MRTLLALTALMLLLATAVWWKTRPGDAPTNLPATTSENPMRGVMTLGTDKEVGKQRNQVTDATFPKSNTAKDVRPSDAGGDHEGEVMEAVAPPQPPVQPPLDPTPEPEPEPVTPVGVTYTVQQGDNLYRIVVRAYGTGPSELVDAVAEANGMRDAGSLSVGQTLTLPLISGFAAPQQP
ncbi:MAG: LysM peptidoglycan-binding domain-containing protein [Planctomycetota bacterium]